MCLCCVRTRDPARQSVPSADVLRTAFAGGQPGSSIMLRPSHEGTDPQPGSPAKNPPFLVPGPQRLPWLNRGAGPLPSRCLDFVKSLSKIVLRDEHRAMVRFFPPFFCLTSPTDVFLSTNGCDSFTAKISAINSCGSVFYMLCAY